VRPRRPSALVVGAVAPTCDTVSAAAWALAWTGFTRGTLAVGCGFRGPCARPDAAATAGALRPAGWSPEAGQWAVSGRATGAGASAGAAVRRSREDRVAQLDLLAAEAADAAEAEAAAATDSKVRHPVRRLRAQARGIATRLGLHLCSVGRLEESVPQADIFDRFLHC